MSKEGPSGQSRGVAANQDETAAAFAVLKAAIQSDPDFAWAWHCNIAMCAFDAGCSHKIANQGAQAFMKMCFDADTSERVKSLGIGAI